MNAFRDLLSLGQGAGTGISNTLGRLSTSIGSALEDPALAQRRSEIEQQQKSQSRDATTKFAVGALRSIRAESDPQKRLDRFNALIPVASSMGIDAADLSEFASVLDDNGEIDAIIAGFGGDVANEETFGVSPQFIRQPDGSVRAVQFGNRGTIRAQDAGGVPLPIEQRFIGLDQGQQRINQAFELADPNFKAQQTFATTAAKEQGKAQGQAIANLPGLEANAAQSVNIIDQILNHPAFNSRFGLTGPLPSIPGTPGADFDALRDQLKGQAFLQAFETLKGGGQITEVEGEKATDAISRVFNPKITPKAARAALEEFKGIIQQGVERGRQKANGGQQQSAFSEGQTATNPNTGERIVFRNGQWVPAQ